MTNKFQHPALNLQEIKPIIFTALSKKYFYMKMLIVKYVLEQGKGPLNPFMSFDYYLADTVDRNIIRNANNNLVRLADELWVFGTISDGIIAEIKQVRDTGKPIKYFRIVDDRTIEEVSLEHMVFEEDLEQYKQELVETPGMEG
jgi:hypothetical protein